MIGLERWERFIAARLHEDEQAAQHASRYAEPAWSTRNRAVIAPLHGVPATNTDQAFAVPPGAQKHIARHDPARALREVEARRRTLARHTGSHVCPEPPDEWHRYEGGERVNYMTPCGDLRDLAAAWADHPEHPERKDEAWLTE